VIACSEHDFGRGKRRSGTLQKISQNGLNVWWERAASRSRHSKPRTFSTRESNRLTFERVIAPEEETQIHAKLQALIYPLQTEINQLNRQFWMEKPQLRANKYDLSTSRYRQVEQDEVYYERPEVMMERLLKLETITAKVRKELDREYDKASSTL